MENVGKRFTRSMLSVILCIILFIFTCILTVLLMLRAGNIALIIRNTDITEILSDTEIAYYLVNQLNSLPFHDSEINLYDLEEFIRSDSVSNEIGTVAGSYIRALNNNDLNYHLSSGDVLNIVKNLEPELNDMFGHQMTEADNILLARTLDDILDFEGLTVGGIIYDAGIDTSVPRLLLSPYLLFGTGLIVLITMCLIFLQNSKKIPTAFMQSGTPITLSGLLYLITGVIFSSYPALLSGRLQTLSRYTIGAMHLIIRYGITLTAIGTTFIVIYLVMKQRGSSSASR